MKVTSTAAAALLLLAAEANGSYFPTFFRGSRQHRALTSQQCLDETDAFFLDGSVLAAFDAVDEEIDDKAACSGAELGKSSCEIDFSEFDSAEQFEEACQAMGGKAIEVNASIDCNGGVTQITRQYGAVTGFSFKYTGLMDCVSMECDDASVQEKVDEAVAKAASTLGSTVGATCSYETNGFESSSSTTGGDSIGTPPTDPDGDGGSSAGGSGTGDVDPGPGTGTVAKDPASSGQCRSLMTAAIGVPLLNLALA